MLPFRSRMVTKIGQATPTRIEGMRAISNQDHQGTCSALPLAAVEGYVTPCIHNGESTMVKGPRTCADVPYVSLPVVIASLSALAH
jgi:hypothetical protein